MARRGGVLAGAGLLRHWSRSDQTHLQLICFPHAGRGASLFAGWEDAFPSGVDLVAVQLPGREDRLGEPAGQRIEELTAAVVADLTGTARPRLALFGHSMGALLAFEVARALRREGHEEPACLLVSGHAAPHLPRCEAPVSALPEHQFVERLRRLGGTPESVLAQPELRAVLLPTLRADLAACESHALVREPPLHSPVVAFAGTADRVVAAHEVAAWAEHTTGRFTLRPVPGDHFTMLGPTLVGLVADEVAAVGTGA